jgi:hypothetical protein
MRSLEAEENEEEKKDDGFKKIFSAKCNIKRKAGVSNIR